MILLNPRYEAILNPEIIDHEVCELGSENSQI